MVRAALSLLLLYAVSSIAANIQGKVVLEEKPLQGVQVETIGMGNHVRRKSKTDQSGRFRFSVPGQKNVPYLLKATYKGLPFYAGPVQFQADTESRVIDVEVYPVRKGAYPEGLLSDLLFLQFSGKYILVDREISFLNPHSYVILPERPLEFPLEGAEEIKPRQNLFRTCCVKVEDQKVLISRPLYPGENSMQLRYRIPREGKTHAFSFTAALPVAQLSVILPFTPHSVKASGVDRKSRLEAHGEKIVLLQKENARRGHKIELSVPLAQEGAFYAYLPIAVLAVLFVSIPLTRSQNAGDPLEDIAKASLIKETKGHQDPQNEVS